MVKSVIKRDGNRVEFDSDKIVQSIAGANSEVEDKISIDDIYKIIDNIVNLESEEITTNEINELVENELIKLKKLDLVRHYIAFNDDHIIKINTTDNNILSLVKK